MGDKKLLRNNLKVLRPDLAREFADEKNQKPVEKYFISSKEKVYWKCERGHIYLAQIKSRVYQKTGCPYCSGRKPIKGETDLVTLFPEIAKEFDLEKNEKSPDEYTGCSGQKVKWKCPRGHSYSAVIAKRTKEKTGCPYCSGRKTIKGKTDLATRFPEIAKEFDLKKNEKGPEQYTAFSNEVVWWICPKKHMYQSSIGNRTNKGNGCPYCSRRKPIKGETDLVTLFPEIAKEFDLEKNEKSPDEYTGCSGQKVMWKCPRGHSYSASIDSRTYRNKGCPYCAGKKPIRGVTDLLTCFPLIAKEFDLEKNKRKPDEFTTGSKKKVAWKCSMGHRWRTSILHRTRGTKCPCCARKAKRKG